MRDMTRLRFLAVGANVSFITYGFTTGVWPVLALHTFLLPLNICRLHEILRQRALRYRNHDGLAGSAATTDHQASFVDGGFDQLPITSDRRSTHRRGDRRNLHAAYRRINFRPI